MNLARVELFYGNVIVEHIKRESYCQLTALPSQPLLPVHVTGGGKRLNHRAFEVL